MPSKNIRSNMLSITDFVCYLLTFKLNCPKLLIKLFSPHIFIKIINLSINQK